MLAYCVSFYPQISYGVSIWGAETKHYNHRPFAKENRNFFRFWYEKNYYYRGVSQLKVYLHCLGYKSFNVSHISLK